MIRDIDIFAEQVLSIPTVDLMEKSGEAVANAVREFSDRGARVIILCGSGNNGGDGYAAAVKLMDFYEVRVFDVFQKGQKSESGKYWMAEYIKCGGSVRSGLPSKSEIEDETDAVVDAIFGTGFLGETPKMLAELSAFLNTLKHIKRIAVDIPLGVSADDGAVKEFALRCDATVALSFPKIAMFSYPAKEFVGRVFLDSLGLDEEIIAEKFSFDDHYVDFSFARKLLPVRDGNTNKGSFGKALLAVGSLEYMGAAALSLEAALRGGAGYVTFFGCDALCDFLLNKFPEALYKRGNIADYEALLHACEKQSSVLIGSGAGCNMELYEAVKMLIGTEGAPLVIDADAINAISKYGNREILKNSKRPVILTPHPLEFSRLCGCSVEYIQANRYRVAKDFARDYRCIMLLKGAATIVTDGVTTYVNGSGSSALAKAGSGDVLAGLLASILAYSRSPLESAALAAYIHGRAGDDMARELSNYGVTPSDIPKKVAKIMAELEKGIVR